MAWTRLIRFESGGTAFFGEPEIANSEELLDKLESGNLYANVYVGDSVHSLSTEESMGRKKVDKIMDLLTPKDVPIIKCVGLNYIKHIKEGGRTPPPYPSIFVKPAACIAGYSEDIPIPQITQDDQLDYEGELAIVIGKTGKNISENDALDHIAGYTVSNDVSARKWQRDPAFAGGVPQWCFSKGFDKFCPVGPMLVSPRLVGAADKLDLKTWVNGELRQYSNTDDLLFGVKAIVAFISQGTTLERGTLVLTGTPAGVSMGMKPPKYLKDGDVVRVTIQHLGSCENRMAFE